jgi:hypothetical protein
MVDDLKPERVGGGAGLSGALLLLRSDGHAGSPGRRAGRAVGGQTVSIDQSNVGASRLTLR